MSEKESWPAWHYGPNGEAEIFECEADVPEGWLDDPNKHGANLDQEPPPPPGALPLTRAQIIADLKERGVRCDVRLPTKVLYDQLVEAVQEAS